MSLGTKRKCEICKELFSYRELVSIPYTKPKQKGFDKIFNTGYKYYCKKCIELI